MGLRSKRLRRGLVAFACVVVAAAAAGPAAAEGPPKPERSPSQGVAPIHPEAAPSASTAQSTQTSYSSYQGSTYQGPTSGTATYTPPSNSGPAVTPPRTSHVRAAKTPVHRAAKKDPPALLPTKPVESIASTGGQILATSAHGLAKAPSSGESLLLLLVGLALVVLWR